MADVTHLLEAAAAGDRRAAADLLPLVYDELRKLAAVRMAAESPDHTLQPTALVHEAFLRLVGDPQPALDNPGHFFAPAPQGVGHPGPLLRRRRRAQAPLSRGGRPPQEAAEARRRAGANRTH